MCGDDGTRRERQTAVSEFEATEWAEIRQEQERQGIWGPEEDESVSGFELLMWLIVLIAVAILIGLA